MHIHFALSWLLCTLYTVVALPLHHTVCYLLLWNEYVDKMFLCFCSTSRFFIPASCMCICRLQYVVFTVRWKTMFLPKCVSHFDYIHLICLVQNVTVLLYFACVFLYALLLQYSFFVSTYLDIFLIKPLYVTLLHWHIVSLFSHVFVCCISV